MKNRIFFAFFSLTDRLWQFNAVPLHSISKFYDYAERNY